MPYERLNDGTTQPPRLSLRHSLWGLSRLPMNAASSWTTDEKFARAKEAGFEGIECWLTDAMEQEHTEALNRHALGITLGHRPYTLEDVRQTVDRAVRLGADFIFAQPVTAFTPLQTVAELCRDGAKIAHDAGKPFFIETHRGNFTENLPQILQLIDAVPEIRFTADLSHLVVVGEFYGWEEEHAVDKLMPILSRTSHAHGRISNGEAVQVDVGEGNTDAARFFVRLWTAAMREWRGQAQPGDIFPFAPELGPPRYAITLPDGSEFSDRWTQSLVISRLAQEAWMAAESV